MGEDKKMNKSFQVNGADGRWVVRVFADGVIINTYAVATRDDVHRVISTWPYIEG